MFGSVLTPVYRWDSGSVNMVFLQASVSHEFMLYLHQRRNKRRSGRVLLPRVITLVILVLKYSGGTKGTDQRLS